MENIKTFSFKRTALLMKKSIYERKSNVLKGFAILFGIFSMIYTISQFKHANPSEVLFTLYYIGLFVMGILVAGLAFPNFRTKEKTISYLALPASHFEKFIAEFLVSTIGFIVIYTITFYLFNILVILGSKYYGIDASIINVIVASADSVKINTSEFLFSCLLIQAVFFLGATTFKKVPPVTTAFVWFIVNLLIIAYAVFLAWLFLSETNGVNADKNELLLNSNWFQIGKFMLYYLLVPALWVIAFLKVKEKEV